MEEDAEMRVLRKLVNLLRFSGDSSRIKDISDKKEPDESGLNDIVREAIKGKEKHVT